MNKNTKTSGIIILFVFCVYLLIWSFKSPENEYYDALKDCPDCQIYVGDINDFGAKKYMIINLKTNDTTITDYIFAE